MRDEATFTADSIPTGRGVVGAAVTCYVLGATCHVPSATCGVLRAACYVPARSWHFARCPQLPRPSAGTHRLRYRNSHRSEIGVYLVNALVPASERVSIVAQRRDVDQRDVTIEVHARGRSGDAGGGDGSAKSLIPYP